MFIDRHPLEKTIGLLFGLAAACALACGGGGSGPPKRSEILVLINEESGISRAIGGYYARARDIPKKNVIRLRVPAEVASGEADAYERISRERFESLIRRPLEAELHERGLVDQIQVIVTTKGIPLGITGERHPTETWLRDVDMAAVDAELSLLFSDSIGVAGVERTTNPYFGSDLGFRDFRRENPDSPLRYMVARLTGYQTDVDVKDGVPRDVRSLLERAQAEVATPAAEDSADGADAAVPERVWLIDTDPEMIDGFTAGNTQLLAPTVAALEALGLKVRLDQSPTFVSDVEQIQGYASWGSNDHHDPGEPFYGEIEGRRFPGTFAERALVIDFVSSNGRSFTAPPRYGQSLVADLLRAGASGAAGHVFEPVLSGVPRPHHLLTGYAEGRPAVEAFYRSIPYLGWMNLYVGDPMLTVPSPVERGDDRDGDGVRDEIDNCIFIPNADQRDTNGDGFGNLCDADIDSDGLVTTSWGVIFPMSQRGDVEWIGLAAQNGPYDADFDLDGDGKVDSRDISIAQLYLFLPPGPSGQAVARPR